MPILFKSIIPSSLRLKQCDHCFDIPYPSYFPYASSVRKYKKIIQMKKNLIEKISSKINGVVSDIDGVLTNGEIVYSSGGEELKSFNVKDGSSIKRLQEIDIKIALISGRKSKTNRRRAKELNIKHIAESTKNKKVALDKLIENGFPSSNICVIGDDIQDLEMFRHPSVTLKISVNDAHPDVINVADFVTVRNGGEGIMVEVSELLIKSKA